MSSSYSRLIPPSAPIKTYGFERVSRAEAREIATRMQRRTFTSEYAHGELFQTVPSPPRAPPTTCFKSPPSEDRLVPSRRVSARMMARMVRRLQRPTLSTMAAEGALEPSEELVPVGRHGRPRSEVERKKVLEKLCKPTHASRSRSATQCACCEDLEKSDWYDVDFSDDHVIRGEQLGGHVLRVTTPTAASRGRSANSESRNLQNKNRKPELPLVSGLAKSTNVDEIVGRLYRPTYAIPITRKHKSTTATPTVCL